MANKDKLDLVEIFKNLDKYTSKNTNNIFDSQSVFVNNGISIGMNAEEFKDLLQSNNIEIDKMANEQIEQIKKYFENFINSILLEINDKIDYAVGQINVVKEVFEKNYNNYRNIIEEKLKNINNSTDEKISNLFNFITNITTQKKDDIQNFIETENLKLQTQMAKSFIVLNSMQQTLIDVQNGFKLIHTGNEQIKDISKLTFNQLQYQSELMRHLNSSAERKEVYLRQILEEVLQMKEKHGEFKKIVAEQKTEQKENEKIIDNYRLDFQNQIKEMLNAIKEKLFSFSADINNLVNVENTADILMQQETERFELGLMSNKRVDVMLYDIKNDIKLLSNNISSLSTEHKEMFVLLKELVEKVSNGRHGEDCEKCGSEKSRIYQCKICGYKDADGVWSNKKHLKPEIDNEISNNILFEDKPQFYWQKISDYSSNFLNDDKLFVVRSQSDTGVVDLYAIKHTYGENYDFDSVSRLLIRNNVTKIYVKGQATYKESIQSIFPNLKRISFEIPDDGKERYILDDNFFKGCVDKLEFFGLKYLAGAGKGSFNGIPSDKREEFAEKNELNKDFLNKNIWED